MKPKKMQRDERRNDRREDVGLPDLATSEAFEEIRQEAIDAADRAFDAHVRGRLSARESHSSEGESSSN